MMQQAPTDDTRASFRLAERYAHFFDRPEARLRFLNNTLARQKETRERLDKALERYPSVRRTRLYEHLLNAWFHHLIFREICGLTPSTSGQLRQLTSLKSRAPLTARILFACYRFRPAFYTLATFCLLGVLYGAYTGAVWSAHKVSSLVAGRNSEATRAASSSPNPVLAQVAAAGLPDYNPDKVWLVEQKDNYERYSNGMRILRDYETTNHPRGYYVYRPGDPSAEARSGHEPAGIVFHTSENDLLPFDETNTDSIEARTRNLLEYVKRHTSYNYLIDRFGQVYRVVRDEDAADHSGNSIWAGPGGLFVGLNESFLGVCFETQTAAGEDERLTEAQLISGRLLTQVLRSRYQIDDANCVTHGLVSVNPTNMRILFHHDWARGFPFETMGLSDKYAAPPASVGEFGFQYDDETLAKLGGELWPGVAEAEAEFAARAARAGQKPDELRRLMRELYRRRMDEQRALRADRSEAEE